VRCCLDCIRGDSFRRQLVDSTKGKVMPTGIGNAIEKERAKLGVKLSVESGNQNSKPEAGDKP
jgi:hypothetical protein